MKKFLHNNKGVTILEGLIALALLALVATGTFAVLLSSSRKASQPDIREEMALAVERATHLIQGIHVYATRDLAGGSKSASSYCSSGECKMLHTGICGGDFSPLATGTHNITCLLPPICDSGRSSFSYNISGTQTSPANNLPANSRHQYVYVNGSTVSSATSSYTNHTLKQVQLSITCNGYSL